MKIFAIVLLLLVAVGCGSSGESSCDYCGAGPSWTTAYPCDGCKLYHFSCGNEDIKRTAEGGKRTLTICPKPKGNVQK